MTQKTAAIVLRSIKFGDSSLIVTCYTECCGLKSYLLKGILKSKRSKIKPALFQVLTQLDIEANHNSKGALNSIREAGIRHHYSEIHATVTKQSIALFLGEVLSQSIVEEEQNPELYRYLETAFLWLDNHHSVANFHLLFLLNLTRYLGFYPQQEQIGLSYFDLLEGKFSASPSEYTVDGLQLTLLRKMLGINFDGVHQVDFTAQNRQEILHLLIRYFELHLSGFKKPRSLEVLKAVFSE
jgi:DNA repair protein RecO (recombination protein O)